VIGKTKKMSLLRAGSTAFGVYGVSRAYRACMEQQQANNVNTPFLYAGMAVNALMYAHPLIMPWTCICMSMRMGVEFHGLRREHNTLAYRECSGIVCSDTF
jgi:hypothetical protein